MRVFVTGTTGFIGSAVVKELLSVGHHVIGLARSDSGAAALVELGVEVHRGDIEDHESLRSGAAKSDGIIHLAFDHDFTKYQQNCEHDRKAIEAMGSALAGSERPLIITSVVGMGIPTHGQLATEDIFNTDHPNPRIVSELAGADAASNGVNVLVVRLPQVHNTSKFGLISPAIDIARDKSVSAYVGEGKNRFSAVHLNDAARLYRLVLEMGTGGARYHAVAEEGISFKEIAEAIGRVLNIPTISLSPEDAANHFGWLAMFVGLDLAASSALTQERLGWHPAGPGLIADLNQAKY